MDGTNSDSVVDAANLPSSTDLLAALQLRADTLLRDLKTYQAYLQENGKTNKVELRGFRRGVESEVRSLATITKRNAAEALVRNEELDVDEHEEYEAKRLHVLRSSNLPFYEAVWNSARQCESITALGKRMYSAPPKGMKRGEAMNLASANGTLPSEKPQRKGALVDIVADHGLKWIKVSTITEKRLLFEMAKEGWEAYGDYSDSASNSSVEEGGSDEFQKKFESRKLDLVRLSEELCAAARSTRVRFQHPTVYFGLPNIREGLYDDVDAVLDDLRATGAIVLCGSNIRNKNLDNNTNSFRPTLTPDNLSKLLPTSQTPPLTSTLNIDCTILLALISDISHLSGDLLPPTPNNSSGAYHSAILRQIDSETHHALLPVEIYPLLVGRRLVCTDQAATRMREIVETMGTQAERQRADIMLGQGAHSHQSDDELRSALATISIHIVPSTLALPIQVVSFDADAAVPDPLTKASSASVADRLSRHLRLSPINKSVFLYGWTHDAVTLTSNRVVASGIIKSLNELLDEDEREHGEIQKSGHGFVGPAIYVCETARSLIGKEKQGWKADAKGLIGR